eukprot:TRINITY_DN35059_c0_g1_i2.p1 TRINITY_DN35059_c0_g1~~TRINITY_DN35059_c0_g1_i2.p1  ORF type:complete len:386 (-),score=72.38 TRINITY_DN35059_c0_g1_i2:200-1357(-)
MKIKKKNKKMQQFTIPKCCQQPRSHAPRPRTDFSPFLSSSPRLRLRPHQGSDFEFSSCKNSGSSITSSTAYQSRRASLLRLEEQNPKFPRMRLSMSSNGDHRCPLNCRQTTCTNVESVAQSAPLEICDSWNNGGHAAEHISSLSYAEVLPYTSNKTASQVAESGNVLAPGCVVWAKTANHTWWPAEVTGERESTNDQTVGRVLVQFYGSHDHAWVDPEGDLSHFEDCFEERICNPTKMFQDALKRALHKKQYLTPSEQWNKSPDAPMNLNHEDQSSDKWNTSSSSRVEDDCHDGGRGKRKRKPKVHFDEVMFPFKSKKKGRRLRIMRHLGLVAPPGSPFTVASHVGREEVINSTTLWSYLYPKLAPGSGPLGKLADLDLVMTQVR